MFLIFIQITYYFKKSFLSNQTTLVWLIFKSNMFFRWPRNWDRIQKTTIHLRMSQKTADKWIGSETEKGEENKVFFDKQSIFLQRTVRSPANSKKHVSKYYQRRVKETQVKIILDWHPIYHVDEKSQTETQIPQDL